MSSHWSRAHALRLKPSGPMHEQLGDIYRVRDENDKAIEQYIKAQSFYRTFKSHKSCLVSTEESRL